MLYIEGGADGGGGADGEGIDVGGDGDADGGGVPAACAAGGGDAIGKHPLALPATRESHGSGASTASPGP